MPDHGLCAYQEAVASVQCIGVPMPVVGIVMHMTLLQHVHCA
jgi:hypothetical protein